MQDARIRGRRGQRIRKAFLSERPLCKECLAQGRTTVATEVDHIVPLALGGENEWSNYQSLCDACHRAKTAQDLGYKTRRVGADGIPAGWGDGDWNPTRAEDIPEEVFWPTDIGRPAIPVTLVCGPPAAGKSTYVERHAHPRDIRIDLDGIVREQGAQPRSTERSVRHRALKERNRRLQALAWYEGPAKRAWFITMAAKPEWRARWAELLQCDRVLVVLAPEAVCASRVIEDPQRLAVGKTQRSIIRAWFKRYTPWERDEIVSM